MLTKNQLRFKNKLAGAKESSAATWYDQKGEWEIALIGVMLVQGSN